MDILVPKKSKRISKINFNCLQFFNSLIKISYLTIILATIRRSLVEKGPRSRGRCFRIDIWSHFFSRFKIITKFGLLMKPWQAYNPHLLFRRCDSSSCRSPLKTWTLTPKTASKSTIFVSSHPLIPFFEHPEEMEHFMMSGDV